MRFSRNLSPREVEILNAAAQGEIDKHLAPRLGICLDTIKRHHEHIKQKLGANNRTHAVAKAVAAGILEVE